MLHLYTNTSYACHCLIDLMHPQLGQYCLLPKQNLVQIEQENLSYQSGSPNHKLIKQKLTSQYLILLLGKRLNFSP